MTLVSVACCSRRPATCAAAVWLARVTFPRFAFSHAMPRRLPAEALYDAIYVATGATEKLPGVPAGFRAAQLPDAGISVPFLEDFGKPVRESACECERSSGMVLGPILKLINGPTVAEALTDPQSALNQLAAKEKDDNKLIEEVFVRFLSRKRKE